MSEGKRFSRESFIYVFGEGFSKSLAFILLPIYARYLSDDDFAILFMVTTLWPVITMLLGQSFSTYIIRGYYEYSDKKSFCGTVLIFSTVVGVLLAVVIHTLGPYIFDPLFKNIQYKPYLQYSVFFAIFRLYNTHVISVFRAKREAKTSVLLSLIFLSINLVSVLAAVFYFKADLLGILNAQVLAYTLAAVFFTIRIWPEITLRFQPQVILPGLRFVLPLIPHALSAWVINYISRIFVERHMSLAELSVYTIAMQLALIISILNSGLNQAWVPFVYANYEKKDFVKLFSINGRKMLLLSILLSSVLLLFSKEILLIIGKPEVLLALNLLPVLTLAYIFQILYMIYAATIIYNKQTKLMPVISITSGVIAILLNIILVPVWGLFGAAFSIVASMAFMALQAYWHSRKYLQAHLYQNRVLLFGIFVSVALLLQWRFVSDFTLLPQIMLKLATMGFLVLISIKLRLLNLQNIRELFQVT